MFNAFSLTCAVAFCTTHGQIKCVILILNVSYLLQVYMAWLAFRLSLSSILLVVPVKYDLPYT